MPASAVAIQHRNVSRSPLAVGSVDKVYGPHASASPCLAHTAIFCKPAACKFRVRRWPAYGQKQGIGFWIAWTIVMRIKTHGSQIRPGTIQRQSPRDRREAWLAIGVFA